MNIAFVTTNSGKFQEVKRWLLLLDPSITLVQEPLDVPEYQTLDVQEVAIGKAQEAWKLLKKPLLIDDGGIYFERFNQFPGTFTKYMLQALGMETLLHLAQPDPRAYFLSCLVYKDSENEHFLFEGICKGTIIKPNKNIIAPQSLPFTKIFVPEGYQQTLAELRESPQETEFHHRYLALKELCSWFKTNRHNT